MKKIYTIIITILCVLQASAQNVIGEEKYNDYRLPQLYLIRVLLRKKSPFRLSQPDALRCDFELQEKHFCQTFPPAELEFV